MKSFVRPLEPLGTAVRLDDAFRVSGQTVFAGEVLLRDPLVFGEPRLPSRVDVPVASPACECAAFLARETDERVRESRERYE